MRVTAPKVRLLVSGFPETFEFLLVRYTSGNILTVNRDSVNHKNNNLLKPSSSICGTDCPVWLSICERQRGHHTQPFSAPKQSARIASTVQPQPQMTGSGGSACGIRLSHRSQAGEYIVMRICLLHRRGNQSQICSSETASTSCTNSISKHETEPCRLQTMSNQKQQNARLA
jgi:hypothetical protein